MRPIALAGALALVLSGCKPAPEPLLVGVFAGDLPCADCPGMTTRLTLVRKDSDWSEGRYLMIQTYRERTAPPLVTTGEWTTLRGDATDDDASVYQLDPDRPAASQNFLKDGETAIRALDQTLKPFPAGLPQILTRQTQGLPDGKAVDCLRGGGVPEAGGACVRP